MVVDHIEDVDQAEENSYQETHPASHYIRGDDEWGPGHHNEEAGGNIIHHDVFVILSADVNIEPSQRQVTQLPVIVEEQPEAVKITNILSMLACLHLLSLRW